MNKNLMKTLEKEARIMMRNNDSSHDFSHAYRVMRLAADIAKSESADEDVAAAAGLLHDVIVYPKNHKHRYKSQQESADFAQKVLEEDGSLTNKQIKNVSDSIMTCSFSQNKEAGSLEGKILQDADALEATGAISIMRTFASAGAMESEFYCIEDPFCTAREADDKKYALDLFQTRLLRVTERLHTERARELEQKRTKFLYTFLDQLKVELDDTA